MIGPWALLEQLSSVLVPLALLLIVIAGIRRAPRSDGGFSLKGLAFLLILVLLPTVSGWRFIWEVRAQRFLHSLSAESVESISIAGQQVTSQTERSNLIHALKEAEWFSNHHGGWGPSVDLRIRLRSGQERRFRVASYLREPGAIIDFQPLGVRGLHAGYVFSRSLPTAFGQAGFDLPR
jgi:hypothetical protein